MEKLRRLRKKVAMMSTVPDILVEGVFNAYAQMSSTQGRPDVAKFVLEMKTLLPFHIKAKYSNLGILEIYESLVGHDTAIVGYTLYDRLHNEIERIYDALTAEYKIQYNYYRKIAEINSGNNKNIYGGTDTESFTGSDSVNGNDNVTTGTDVTKDETTGSRNTYDRADLPGFRPIEKAEHLYKDSGSYNESYNYTTEYGKVKTDTFGKTLDMEFGRKVDTEIEGNNGIYPYPDLIEKEYVLRIKRRLTDTILDLFVREVSSGVWITE